MANTKSDNDVVIDWIDVVRDMPEIIKLEEKNEGPEAAWPEALFLEELATRNVCGFTAKKSGRLCGFYVYFLSKESILILNMQTTELTEADGDAALRALLNKLKAKLGKGLRTSITILVRERKLSLQQALRREGFKATEVIRNYFLDTCEDCYVFVYEADMLEVSMAKGFMKSLQ